MKYEEHYIQKSICHFLDLNGVFYFAVPNAARRNVIQARILKEEGMRAGSPDLVLMLPKRIVFVEVKNGKAGKQSESQKEFQRKAEELGFEYKIWRGLDDCMAFFGVKYI